MCLIVFAYKVHPQFKLILSANRDEFYKRPTNSAGWWDDKPQILAGRDLVAKGTWMGITKSGRFAAVTNYRDIQNIRNDTKSRGDLPVRFLEGSMDAKNYGKEIKEEAEEYNGFNLLAYDEEMMHISNYEHKVNELQPGIYGLSNALLDTPWTKVREAKKKLARAINDKVDIHQLVDLLTDTTTAPDQELPKTGLDYAMEKALSPMCIRTPEYGTCCSTALTIKNSGAVDFVERTYPVGDRQQGVKRFEFKVSQ